jgi:hypothetical protein
MRDAKQGQEKWQLSKEKILFVLGIVLILYEGIFAGFFHQEFHFEVLLTGLALCGVSVAQWWDNL